jgi:carbamoyl-phosphate synthase small subunit
MIREAVLVLADGTTFEGEAVGADVPVASGEVVFNTVLSGYQEVITDPSYAGQIITFTYPHIGNYGVSAADDEAARPSCRGVVVRELARRPSSWRHDGDLDSFLRRHGLAGIAGVDTRRLTRHIREAGAMPGAFGTADETTLKAAALAEPGTDGVDLVAEVSTKQPYRVGTGPWRVVAYDFGIKATMLRQLGWIATVNVVPASTPAADVLAGRPDGVFLANGPGDPAMVPYASAAIGELLGAGVPVFGICLGHQLLARALGADTVKLPFGHHGGNHPVRRLATGTVEITSQNHNFAVAADTLAGRAEVTHVNLNDGVCEGLRVLDAPAFSVQYHPEAGPGPHDARYLFKEFDDLMARSSRSPADSDDPGIPYRASNVVRTEGVEG